MIWRLRRQEPSFSSRNEKSFESRRVRTQPWTWTPEIGAVVSKAALMDVGPGIRQLCRAMALRQASCSDAALPAQMAAIAIDALLRRPVTQPTRARPGFQSAVTTTGDFRFAKGQSRLGCALS